MSVVDEVRRLAGQVRDPELPVLTLADLGVLRAVAQRPDGRIVVNITPTYTGCPALEFIRADLRAQLANAGYHDVEVRTVLSPPWSTDWISERGRQALAEHGIAPPQHVGPPATGPVPLRLEPPTRAVRCPRCGSPRTTQLSFFGATACTALRRCEVCAEPFEHVKEI
jgi:ring-1,2-phenylacetyl-CoA epoxidase subunit PaaD